MLQFTIQNSRQKFLKICFPQDERSGENYDLLYQNSIRNYEDEIVYLYFVLFIFFEMVWLYGFVSNIYQIGKFIASPLQPW